MRLLVVGIVISLGIALSSSSFADVTSNAKYAADYPEVIHVTVNPDQTATFQYCEGPNLTDCRFLGNKERYKLRDLQRREQILKRERRTLIISDATYVAGSALASIIITVAAPAVTVTAVVLYAATGAAGSGIFVLRSFMDNSPDGAKAKLSAPKTLTASLLRGDSVQVNMPINEFAQQLDGILKSIF